MAQQQQSQGLHSLSTIIKRLEAVTSRLEDVAVSQSTPGPHPSLRSPTGTTHEILSGHVAPPSAPPSAPAPPPPPPPPPPAVVAEDLPPAIKAYETDIIDGPLAEFTGAAKNVGGLVEQHSALLPVLLTQQLAYLKMAAGHAKPAASGIPPLLKPQADAIGAIMEGKDKFGRTKEGREWGPAFSVLSEGAAAWGWVQVEPAPAPYVAEMRNAAQFWVDRVIKQYKDTRPEVVTWARSFSALVDALQKYVKQWHTTGVTWNPKGPAAPSSVPTAASAPPPPPPPPAAAASSAPAGGTAALLADLNKGGAITSGLRKVDSSQQTHKNPELRAGGTVPDVAKKEAPPVKAKPGTLAVPAKKPPKLELEDGNKWLVEYQEDNKSIVIDQTALHHTVHIFGCKNSVIRITGKINAVTMVNCKKTSVVIDSAVSSLSVTSSPSFEAQITGYIPTIQVDTTDSGQVYLSKECMDTIEIITSKTSALNISIPTGDDGDYEERPVPEQLKSKIVNGKLVTEIVEHSG